LSGGTSQLASFSRAGLAPKETRTLIRESGSLATQKDIYNQIAAAQWASLKGQSPIHALTKQLSDQGFWSQIQFASDGYVTAVLFTHPDSLHYLQAYPNLLFLDCTYKTNKYHMPLLDITGIDATQWSFCIAFAFLSNKSKEDYTWVLKWLKSLYEQCNTTPPSVILTDHCLAAINAATILFPSATTLICIWHANKAVLAWCQPAFPEANK